MGIDQHQQANTTEEVSFWEYNWKVAMEKETQTCCPKPIQGMSVHWRQQNSH
jgi:hypothetical protein